MAENIVLPAGVYEVRIQACDLHDFKTGGQGFRMRFKPTAKEHKDANVTFWIPFDHASEKYLSNGLRLLQELWFGIGQAGDWQDAKFAAATFEGGLCAVKLSVQDDKRTEGAKQNVLQSAFNMDGKKYKKPPASAPVVNQDEPPF